MFLSILPFLILVFLFSYFPLYGWVYSLYDYKPALGLSGSEFVGLQWFRLLIGSPTQLAQIGQVMANTLGMSFIGIASSVLPLAFAVFLNEIRAPWFRNAIQTLTTLPNFISWVLVYMIAFSMFSTTGLVNTLMLDSGLITVPTKFLDSDQNVWLTMAAWGIWKTVGWGAIMYLAAIAGIDQALYESAKVDGAGRFQRGVDLVGCDVRVRVRLGRQFPGECPGEEDSARGPPHVLHPQQPRPERRPDGPEGVRGVRVAVREGIQAGEDRGGVRLGVGGVGPLGAGEVGGRVGVRDRQQVRVGGPHGLEQLLRRVGRASVDEVVGGHHATHHAGLDGLDERRQVVLVQHPGRQVRRRRAAVQLVVVGQEVLEGGDGPPEHVVVAAEPGGVGDGALGGDVRVLGVALLVAAPQGVAQRVDHGRPHVQRHPDGISGVLGAHLRGGGLAELAEQLRVPGGGHAHRLREDGRGAGPRHAVQRLRAGVELCQAVVGHRGVDLVEQGDALVVGEPGQRRVHQCLEGGTGDGGLSRRGGRRARRDGRGRTGWVGRCRSHEIEAFRCMSGGGARGDRCLNDALSTLRTRDRSTRLSRGVAA
ncbi:sugar ABC transporter permease [Tessaracoccus sp. MC1679]|nr:sugar ABC transporter permease [Tessaracoccus sp. MC1679]